MFGHPKAQKHLCVKVYHEKRQRDYPLFPHIILRWKSLFLIKISIDKGRDKNLISFEKILNHEFLILIKILIFVAHYKHNIFLYFPKFSYENRFICTTSFRGY